MTPITAEHKVAAIVYVVLSTMDKMAGDLVSSTYGYALASQLLGRPGYEQHRIDLTIAQAEKVYKIFLDACAFVPDIRRLEKGVIPDGKAIMRRVRSEINEREAIRAASKKDAIAQMASASGLL